MGDGSDIKALVIFYIHGAKIQKYSFKKNYSICWFKAPVKRNAARFTKALLYKLRPFGNARLGISALPSAFKYKNVSRFFLVKSFIADVLLKKINSIETSFGVQVVRCLSGRLVFDS